MKTTLEILQEARSLIAKGWTQHQYRADKLDENQGHTQITTCYCPLGAINHASTNGASHGFVYDNSPFVGINDLARQALWPYMGDMSIAEWNDKPGRTKEEVIEAFDKAIATLVNAN